MVSSLHASVLGTTVYGPGASTSVSNTSTSSSTSSTTMAASYDSASFSSTGKMMAAEGSHPPDFDSMSTEDFREHLIELQEKMASDGIDTSGFTDPSTMSEADLNALKDEMSSMGKGGPHGKQGPPPPPPSSSSSTSETSESDALEVLLAAMEDQEESFQVSSYL